MNDAFIDALACYRLTRLITKDTITAPARGAVAEYAYATHPTAPNRPDPDAVRDWSLTTWAKYAADDERAPLLAELITCTWCTSIWVGFGVVAARTLAPRAWNKLATAFAMSAVASLVQTQIG